MANSPQDIRGCVEITELDIPFVDVFWTTFKFVMAFIIVTLIPAFAFFFLFMALVAIGSS